MQIEQAIFTSARTSRAGGYHLVARSPGLPDADARELVLWGPSHDSLWDNRPGATSINFHPLPSGAYCISRSTNAGAEYSGRAGCRIYTQCLVVPAEVLARFANNPFALLKAAIAAGVFEVFDEPPAQLAAVRLHGRSSPLDQALLAQVTKELGPLRLATLVKAALDTPNLGIVVGGRAESVIAALFSCLPLEQRPSYSFSTGLRYSPQRPFRLITLPSDTAEHRAVQRRCDLEILDLTGDVAGQLGTLEGWAGEVARAIAAGKFDALAARIGQAQHLRQTAAEVDLGQRLAPAATEGNAAGKGLPGAKVRSAGTREANLRGSPSFGTAVLDVSNASAAGRNIASCQSMQPRVYSPTEIELLGRLDDLVFESLSGKTDAAAELHRLWPSLKKTLAPEVVEESREHYVRHVIHVWRDCLQSPGTDLRRAAGALEVLAELFGE